MYKIYARVLVMAVCMAACTQVTSQSESPDGGVEHASLTTPQSLTVPDTLTSALISPLNGVPESGTGWTVANGSVQFIGSWDVPIDGLRVGDHMWSVSSIIRDNGTANGHPGVDSNTVIMFALWDVLGQSENNSLGGFSSASTGTAQVITLAVDHVVQPMESLRIRFVTFAPNGGRFPSSIGTAQVVYEKSSN